MVASVKIEFGELKDKTHKGQPYQHIHGYLNFELGGKSVPYMGYWGKDDVCFNQWIDVLVGIRRAVQEQHPSHKFDEFEQGQPAFLFEIKPLSRISFSIVKSEIGEGFDHPDWQQVIFEYSDFKVAFLDFKDRFLARIEELAPQQVSYWASKFNTN